MIIEKFSVKNYKSIIDSGDCYLESDLTIIAGKNESGKSSLLEALYDFNISSNIEKTSVPISKKNEDLKISLTFKIEKNELKDIVISNTEIEKLPQFITTTITKDYYDEYYFEPAFLNLLSLEDFPENYFSGDRETILNNINAIKLFAEENKAQSDFPVFSVKSTVKNIEDLKAIYDGLVNYQNELAKFYKANSDLLTEDAEISKSNLDVLVNDVKDDYDILAYDEYRFGLVLNLIPNFVLFRSFEDTIPNSIGFKDIPNNSFIKDLKLVSNIDTDLIISKETRDKHKHKSSLNININKDYANYWTQDITQFKIEWDSEQIFFWVEEEEELFEPSQRSKGKQWHLSFYFKTSARTVEGKKNVYLVDEPGLFLHAAAQRDIYQRLLITASDENIQVVFTTHSPYLIKADELHRIRLVDKTNIERGTKVSNKIHAVADKETLTPILTAIGLELNAGIHSIQYVNNVIVEGPADKYYLDAFKKILGYDTINFVFGGGSGNMGNVGAILSGWGCRVLYLFDNDQGKRDGSKNLRNTWYVPRDFMFSVTEIADGAIEDVFSQEEFAEFVLNDKSISIEGNTSDFIKASAKEKSAKIDKVLVARQFLSNVTNDNVKLSDETRNKLKVLMNSFSDAFTKFEK